MEQIISMILGQSNVNLQAFGLNVRTQAEQPVAIDTVEAKIALVAKLNSIPAVQQFVNIAPYMGTVNSLDSMIKMGPVIGVDPTAEQVKAINDKIDGIIGELETDLKNRLLASLGGLGLGTLAGLVR